MKNRIILMAAAIAAMAVSCQKVEISTPVVKTEPMVITAGAETKTVLAGTDVLWTAGDKVMVLDNQGGTNVFEDSALTDEEPAATANFAGLVNDGTTSFFAVYPSSSVAEGASYGKLIVTIPTNQTPKSGSFAKDHNISVASGSKTPGTASVGNVEFVNVCGLLKFTVPSYVGNVSSVTVSTPNEQALAGNATITYQNGSPVLSIAEGGEKAISMSGTFAPGSTFWFVVAPQTLEGLIVTVIAGNNTYVMSTDADILIESGHYRNIGVLKLGTTASAAHTYANNVLTGTAVTVNLIKPTIGTVNLNVYNNNGTLVREYSTEITSEEPKSIVLPSNEKWPYLPKGDYIVSGSYTTSDGKTENLYNLNLNINEDPDFAGKGSESFSAAAPMTSYSYYSSNPKNLDKANSMDALTIENVSTGKINLPDNIKNNKNYSIGKTVAVDNDATISEDKTYATATKLGQHTVTTTYTFDGVSVRKDAICYITGLPHTGLPNKTLWEQTNYAAEVDWEGNGSNTYVKLEGLIGSASGIRTKNGFFTPSGVTIAATVNINVNFLSKKYWAFGTRYYKARLVCQIGNTEFISEDPDDGEQYSYSASPSISISNGDKMLIECQCWTTGPNISIYNVDILYQ